MAHTVGGLKLFNDETLPNRLMPEWMHRERAKWQHNRHSFSHHIGYDGGMDPITFIYESYRGGVHAPEAGIVLKPGESCLNTHLTDAFSLRETSDTSPLMREDARKALGRITLCLRFLSTFIDTLPEMNRPKYVASHTHTAVARAAMRLGFEMHPAAPDILSGYAKFIWQMYCSADGYSGGHWMISLSTQELRERYPALQEKEKTREVELRLGVAWNNMIKKHGITPLQSY